MTSMEAVESTKSTVNAKGVVSFVFIMCQKPVEATSLFQ